MHLRRRSPTRDPIPPSVKAEYAHVFERDGSGCVAPTLDATAGECRDKWGNLVAWNDPKALTFEHVHEGYGKAGKRAPSDRWHLVVLCWGHGVQSWELSHKDVLRAYLLRVEGAAA